MQEKKQITRTFFKFYLPRQTCQNFRKNFSSLLLFPRVAMNKHLILEKWNKHILNKIFTKSRQFRINNNESSFLYISELIKYEKNRSRLHFLSLTSFSNAQSLLKFLQTLNKRFNTRKEIRGINCYCIRFRSIIFD